MRGDRSLLLLEARLRAWLFRLAGFPNACVLDAYCVREAGPDRIYTRTICIYLGRRFTA